MPNLNSILSFATPNRDPLSTSAVSERTPIPPASSHILVTDTIDSPAAFVLIHFIRAAHTQNRTIRSSPSSIADVPDVKGKSRAVEKKVIWISCDANGFSHWKNVVRKSGVALDIEQQKGLFCYINGLNVVLEDDDQSVSHTEFSSLYLDSLPSIPLPTLKKLYDLVSKELSSRDVTNQKESPSWEADTIIVVDDLTALSWNLESTDVIGRPVDVSAQVSRWVKALRALAAKNSACLVTLQHVDATSVGKDSASDPVDETVFRNLVRTADVWVEVKELGSGRARDCDGEITVHPLVRPSLAQTATCSSSTDDLDGPPLVAFAIETPCPSRSKAVLYRIAPDGQAAAQAGGIGVGTNTGRLHVWARGTGRGFL